jgi:hypothetical protein
MNNALIVQIAIYVTHKLTMAVEISFIYLFARFL